jgi:phthalate 4,5-cis-dihydrodiol dehydrogenase
MMRARRVRLGVAGLGRAFTMMLPTFAADPRIELVAAADPRPEATRRFAADFGARTYASFAALCADPEVEAIYIATPHQHHAAQAIAAAAQRKHVLVEKPMALTLDEARQMIAAAKMADVRLVVGHSHSFDGPILRTRDIIASGEVGAVRMITAQYYTDYLYRPRRPEELDTARGGGAVFNQAAHQVDIVRLLGGGRVRSVRAHTGAWDPTRPTEGAYAALLTFDDGAFASLTYSGYGHFDGDEFCGNLTETGLAKDPGRYGAARRALAQNANAADELAAKNARNYGGAGYADPRGAVARPWHQHFGLVIVSCERADLRPLPEGVMVYGDAEARLDPLPKPDMPRAAVVDELCAAVIDGKSPLHDGPWALATLEVCLALLESARGQREVTLHHQAAARAP